MHRFLVLFLCLLPACNSTKTGVGPSRQELTEADYGIEPIDYKERILSATYADGFTFYRNTFEPPRRTWYGNTGGLLNARDIRYGWGIKFRGFKLGFTSADDLAVERTYYFRNNRLDAVSEKNGALHFYDGSE